MDILQKIIAYKKPLLEQQKRQVSIENLQNSRFFKRSTLSLSEALKQPDSSGIIAEFKRRSPSKPAINLTADVKKVTAGYQQAGAAALSVLTDTHFFDGKNIDIEQVRNFINIPILRKDFIFDVYQVYEAKSIGADAILLIAEVLSKDEILKLAKLANELGLEVLLEIHSASQLDKINPYINVLGINNRNLKTFEVSIDNSIQIAGKLLGDIVKISESGIRSPEDVKRLRSYGFQGFLIGESFMKTAVPEEACRNFIDEINKTY